MNYSFNIINRLFLEKLGSKIIWETIALSAHHTWQNLEQFLIPQGYRTFNLSSVKSTFHKFRSDNKDSEDSD